MPTSGMGRRLDDQHSVEINLATNLVKNTVVVFVNGVKTNALVDTGASISVISTSFLSKTSFENSLLQTPDYQYVNGVGGHLKVLGKLKLPITFKGGTFSFPVHVVDRLPHSLIIGLDFLQKHQVTLNLAENTMTFYNDSAKVNVLKTNSGLARVAKTITVPPFSENIVSVRVSKRYSGEEVLLEPTTEIQNLNILGAKCFVRVRNGQSAFKVLNPTNQEIQLQKGKVLACVSDVDSSAVYNFDDDTATSSIHNTAQVNIIKTSQNTKSVNTQSKTVNTQQKLSFDLSNSDLNAKQKQELTQFLHKNRDIFASGYHELGQCNTYLHKIETDPNSKPVKMPFYRTTPSNHSEINRQVEDLLKNDIIQESNSEWHSPCLLVKKASGEFRLVTDFRKLNKITKPMSFPLPRLECVFDTIGQSHAQIFTSLDLHSAFLQIGMHPDSRHKAAFITQNGIYEYKRMPYGLMNAPVSFQMVMTQVLRGLTWRQCLIYLDDILVFSETFDDHLTHLNQIFSRLRNANLKLKPSKCDFAAKEIKYLGHIISKHGVRTDPEKTKAVSTFPLPKTQKDVRSFLGMCNYYRKFVQNYSKITSPLNNLLCKDVKFEWTDECQNSFDSLKKALVSSPILSYPDMSRNFTLTCDASSSAIGFVLGQLDGNGKEHVIAYGGRSLSPCEKKWSTSEQEMLAVLEGIRSYRIYLSDKKFTIYTDHKALKYVMDQKRSTGRLARWAMEIQSYQFDIIHRPGKNNQVADALSRREYDKENKETEDVIIASISEKSNSNNSLPNLNSDSKETETAQSSVPSTYSKTSQMTEVSFFYSEIPDVLPIEPEIEISLQNPNLSDLSKIASLQQTCPDFQHIYNYLHTGDLPEGEKLQNKIIQTSKFYDICNGVLYHWFQRRVKCTQFPDDKWIQQLALPRSLRAEAMKAYHDNSAGGAHLGIEKVMAAMKSKYHWPRMHQEIYDYIHSCETCQLIKRDTHARPPPLTSLPVVGRFERWHMDFLKLHKTNQGYQYVLLVVDSFTKWVEAFPMKSQEAVEVAKCLFENIFSRFGCPKSLVSDRGKSFMNNLVTSLCDIFEIKHFLTSSYHPQTNSQVERTNSTLIQCLRAYTDKEQNNWPSKLPGILMALRNSPSTQSTDYSPFYMVFGIEMNLPFDIHKIPKDSHLSQNSKEQLQQIFSNLQTVHEVASKNIKKSQEKSKERFDKHAKVPNFKLFDKVLIKSNKVPIGLSPKLAEKYQGPYFISELGPNHTYKIRRCSTRKELKSFMNASQLKKYYNPDIERAKIAQPQDPQAKNQHPVDTQDSVDTQNVVDTQSQNTQPVNIDTDGDDPQTQKQADEAKDDTQEYPYDIRRLVKYRNKDQYFYIEWSDGSKTWEPQENVRPDLVAEYFQKYTKKGRVRKK